MRADLDATTRAQAGDAAEEDRARHFAAQLEFACAALLAVDANLGDTHKPAVSELRTNLYRVSAAALHAATDRPGLVLDLDWDSNSGAARSTLLAVGLVGAIYTCWPRFDIDICHICHRSHLNSAAIDRQWLHGVTYRGAP